MSDSLIDIVSEIFYDQRPVEVDVLRAPWMKGQASESCWRGWWVMLVATSSSMAAAEPEVELVSRYLTGPVASAEERADEAATRAAATAPTQGLRPTLEARREVARGPAGASSDVVGGAVALDLGRSAWAERQAAVVRADAEVPLHKAHRLEAICGIRTEVLLLWAADAHAEAQVTALSRLESLLGVVAGLVEAGERSDYERQRLALMVQVQRSAAAAAAGGAAAQRAQMAALLGGPVGAVTLSALTTKPAAASWSSLVQQHPLLIALRMERDATAREVAAARRDAAPELSLTGGTRWDAPPDGGPSAQGYEVGASLALPDIASVRRGVRAAEAGLAAVEARLAQETAALAASAEGASQRLEVLAELPVQRISSGLWETSWQRYRAGESSLEEVMQIAAELAAVQDAVTEQVRLTRQARLDLSCAVGYFDEPEIQSVFEDDTP